MSIKAKLIIAITFSLVVTTMIGFILFQNTSTLKQQIAEQVIISELQSKLFERAMFRDEYLLYHEERSAIQWEIISKTIDELIQQVSQSLTLVDQQVILKAFGDNEKTISQIFYRLVENFTNRGGNPSTTNKDLEPRLVGQLFVKSQENFAFTSQLTNASRSRVIEGQNRTTIFILIFFASSSAILVSVLSFIWLSIAKPLIRLKEAAVRIASLDFSSTTTTTTTTTSSKDEIGQLGSAFNEMAGKLKSSYRTLEQKVRDRTKDLELARVKDEALLESIGDGIIAVDTDGKIILMNQSAQEMLGWHPESMVGKIFHDTVASEDEKGVAIPIEKRPIYLALAGTTTTGPTYQYVRKDKTKFPVAIKTSPIILDRKIVGAVEVFRDITREKEIDQAKTEFVSLAAHQLRTPLTGISWIAEIFLENGRHTSKDKNYIKDIIFLARRLNNLVEVLLNVSRIESGRIGVKPEPVDLVEFIGDFLREYKAVGEMQKLTIIFIKHPKKLVVVTDANLLNYILQNLFGNALRYTPVGGTVEIVLEEKKNSVIFAVRDTGIGIPEKEKGSIFEKFVRASNAVLTRPDGTGLGLFIAQESVRLLGGKVWFKSKEGEGSTFYVELPIISEVKSGEVGLIGNGHKI